MSNWNPANWGKSKKESKKGSNAPANHSNGRNDRNDRNGTGYVPNMGYNGNMGNMGDMNNMGDMQQWNMSGGMNAHPQTRQSHSCSQRHHSHKMQHQQQKDAQEEAQIELLKDEINSLFMIFDGIIDYLKSDKVKQSGLLTRNDSAVASLKLFGATCKRKSEKVLKVAHHHFIGKLQNMDQADQRVIKHWLNYAEAGLLGKKLKKLQISKITIDAAHEYMKQGGLVGFLDSYVGAEHTSYDIVANATENREELRKQNAKTLQQHQQTYKQRQAMVPTPGQQQMYGIAGGAENIEFGSSLYHESSAYYDQRPTDDRENEDEKSDSNAMDEDEPGCDDDNAPDQAAVEHPWLNAYVIKAPQKKVTRGVYKKPVKINYPYPCRIIPGVVFDDGQVLGVQFARPNDDLRVRIHVSNLERDSVKVSKLEQQYMSVCKLSGDKPLGYESVLQQQFQ